MNNIVTTTGKILRSDYGMCESLNRYATGKGVESVVVYYAVDDNVYLLVKDGIPIKSSTVAENIAVHIDILAIAEMIDED